MSSINPIPLARVSDLQRSNMAARSIQRGNKALLDVQNQLTSGRTMMTPADDPGRAAISMSLRKLMEQRQQYGKNLQSANTHLSHVDTALDDVSTLLREAQQIASANVGSDATADSRLGGAAQLDAIFDQLFSLANKSSDGVYLFAGDRSTMQPFESNPAGVRWVGSKNVLANDYDEATRTAFMVNGAEVFGATSTRVQGRIDLTPSINDSTRLSELKGASSLGISKGTLSIGDGTAEPTLVDLSNADTIGDVIDAINNAGIVGVNATLNSSGTGIDIEVAPSQDLRVRDVGAGTIARDLGIQTSFGGNGPGATVAGQPLNATITPLTPVGFLRGGLGIDPSGLSITNGTLTKQISFSGANTVEDVLNRINTSGANVRASINATGTGIDLVNATQGSRMSIGENGGTTAADMGLSSFDPSVTLAELNGGKGVTLSSSGNDLRITDSGGTVFEVDLDGAATIADVIARFNTAASTAGAGVTLSVAAAGNGLEVNDTTGGSGTLMIASINFSSAAADLGLDQPVISGVMSGRDVNPIESTGVFASLDRLRKAMRAGDQREMTRAAEELDADYDRVVSIRGQAGAKVKEFERRLDTLEDIKVQDQKTLSELEDVDYTEAITRFQTIQTSLEASLATTGRVMNLSLFDFLR
jgi:flagellar hook-associated protein 3 FlgL